MRVQKTLVLPILLISLAVSACDTAEKAPEATPDPHSLLAEGVAQLQNASSFKYEIDVSGYRVDVPITGVPEDVRVSFKYASGVYQVPNRLSAHIQFRLGVLSTTAELIMLDQDQYFRGELLTGNRWLKADLIPGFSPAMLMAQPGGIAHTLSTVSDLMLVGRKDLDGLSAYELRGRVEAGRIFSLTLGLSRSTSGLLDIEVYMGTRDRRVARVLLVEPPPLWDADSEPTTWLINISDYNALVSIEAPDTGEES